MQHVLSRLKTKPKIITFTFLILIPKKETCLKITIVHPGLGEGYEAATGSNVKICS